MEASEKRQEVQFTQQLTAMYNAKKGVLMKKEEYFEIIEQLKEANLAASASKTPRQYYILKRYI